MLNACYGITAARSTWIFPVVEKIWSEFVKQVVQTFLLGTATPISLLLSVPECLHVY